MQVARLIFAGSIALAAGLAAPALANNANLNSHANALAQKIEDKPAAQGRIRCPPSGAYGCSPSTRRRRCGPASSTVVTMSLANWLLAVAEERGVNPILI